MLVRNKTSSVEVIKSKEVPPPLVARQRVPYPESDPITKKQSKIRIKKSWSVLTIKTCLLEGHRYSMTGMDSQ